VAANVSLVLVVVGWLLVAFTVLWNLGDSNLRTPPAELLRQRHLFAAVLWIAVLFLLGSQILAGLAFREAKRRSLLAFAVFVLPLMVFGVLAVMGGI
jgi:hypothetical protein